MDLSKAYDCRPYDLLLAKLLVCGFDVSAIALIANYLSNRYQNVKIGSTFTSCVEILRAVPSSSITGLMLSNLFINGLMFFIQDKKQMAATLPMIQQYIHAHQILKRQLWNDLMTRIWFLTGLELIIWWQTLANFRLCFLGQTLIITKLHLWEKIKEQNPESKLNY